MADFETFNLLFKADASQLKKEVDDVKKKTGELTESSKKSEEQTKKTDNEFQNFAKTLAKTAAAYFSVSSVIAGFQNTLAKTVSVGKAANILGVGVEDLDALGRAFKNFGGDAAEIQNSIATLSKEFNTTGQNIYDYVLELAEGLSKMDKATAYRFGQDTLKLSPQVISYLYQNPNLSSDIAEQKRLGVTTQEDVDLANKFNESLGKMGDSFDRLFRAISADKLETLIKFVDGFTKIVEHLNSFTRDKGRPKAHDYIRWENLLNGGFYSKPPQSPELIRQLEEERNRPAVAPPDPYEHLRHIPTLIPPVSNSQANNFSKGSININTTAQDGGKIYDEMLAKVNQNSQYMQSNAYYDDMVVA